VAPPAYWRKQHETPQPNGPLSAGGSYARRLPAVHGKQAKQVSIYQQYTLPLNFYVYFSKVNALGLIDVGSIRLQAG
jgi:hypothetical protein